MDNLVLFAKFGIRWEGNYIDHDILHEGMTPEQVELLSIKCHKFQAKEADMVLAAVQGVVATAFGKKAYTPSDLLDMRLGYEVEGVSPPEESGPSGLTQTQRRKKKFGHWEMSDFELAQWLTWRNYSHGGNHELGKYFTKTELEALGICLIEKKEDGDNV